MITLDLRHAIAAAGHTAADPGLRPGGEPGRYASSVAFALASGASGAGRAPERIAAEIAERLRSEEPWIEKAEVTGRGYVMVTVTARALEHVADRVAEAGPDCVRSDALAGHRFARPARVPARRGTAWDEAASWDKAAAWEEARELVAAEVTARLAEAAGAEVAGAEVAGAEATGTEAAGPEAAGAALSTRSTGESEAVDESAVNDSGAGGGGGGVGTIRSGEKEPRPAATVAYAGRDAVRFFLARAIPGQKINADRQKIARHDLGNPAYAVRYAHARAASGVRWAAAADPDQAGPQRHSADPGELALLDALSWLPERVAGAARRSRPDEFARYLERVADVTLAALTRPAGAVAPGSDRLALARAARTGLAAGLELLGVGAPDRLLPNTRTPERSNVMSELASESASTVPPWMRPAGKHCAPANAGDERQRVVRMSASEEDS